MFGNLRSKCNFLSHALALYLQFIQYHTFSVHKNNTHAQMPPPPHTCAYVYFAVVDTERCMDRAERVDIDIKRRNRRAKRGYVRTHAFYTPYLQSLSVCEYLLVYCIFAPYSRLVKSRRIFTHARWLEACGKCVHILLLSKSVSFCERLCAMHGHTGTGCLHGTLCVMSSINCTSIDSTRLLGMRVLKSM